MAGAPLRAILFVLGTGLVLSFEPWLIDRAIAPGSLTPARALTLLDQHDPSGQARALSFRSYDNTLTIGGGRGGGTAVDVATGQARPGPSGLATVLVTMRRMHETLLLDAGWLVIGSTAAIAMILLLVTGPWIWLRRRLRRRAGAVRRRPAPA